MASGWHHHGDHETVIYVLTGAIRLEFGRGGAEQVDGREGDFLLVPPHAIHRESNQSAGESTFVVTRASRGAPVVNVEGPEA